MEFAGGDYAPKTHPKHFSGGQDRERKDAVGAKPPPGNLRVSFLRALRVCAAGRGERRASGLVPWVGGACLISIQARPRPGPAPAGWIEGGKRDYSVQLFQANRAAAGKPDGTACGFQGRGRPARGLHGDGNAAPFTHSGQGTARPAHSPSNTNVLTLRCTSPTAISALPPAWRRRGFSRARRRR